ALQGLRHQGSLPDHRLDHARGRLRSQLPAPVNQTRDVLGELYAAEIAKRGFSADAAQLAAIRHLERLRAELTEAASAPLGKRLLRGLTSNGDAPKGVYLWGGVGRGKTWLTDLFYGSLTLA